MTCGGLCPGLNDVVQNIAYTLRDYGVPEDNILGIKCALEEGKRGTSSRCKCDVHQPPSCLAGLATWHDALRMMSGA